ncbi:apses-domain-containing protein [Choiromyces venosus 120613-1]|uniref:Apses-domain-containing protein n=1 Tax=Choiromyces venosus 120613-1 TaxID=1336337 RepID=A0A3N4IZT2_9PEZI|nr:apses-domain-containing protein [Choiromyces venosus 120613-1]
MRRRSDSWVNATQVLKVAEFDKPQRTRILEREVQRGLHEKVQGGYGKYQGTWVPLERAREIAALYNVEELLKPIFDFRPSTESPPLAPKHVTAASTKPRPSRAQPRAPAAPPLNYIVCSEPTPPVQAPPSIDSLDEVEVEGEDDDLSDLDPLNDPSSPSVQSSSASDGELSELEIDDRRSQNSVSATLRKRKREQMDHEDILGGFMLPSSEQRKVAYSDELLDYFMANEKGLPEFLVNPPPDFDVNEVIDDEGHTAFHWAASMGDLRVIELLYQAEANIFMVNKRGETPLMRAVLFTNNYDRKSFPRLVETLRETIFHVDNYNSTVFHHIAATTSSRNKLLAARYYFDVLLQKLGEKHSMPDIAMVLDLRDSLGDTALTIAARNGAKKCVRSLLAHNANPNIPNNEGQTADQYIVAVERQRRNGDYPPASSSSPFQSHEHHPPHIHNSRFHRHPSTQSVATVAAVNYANNSYIPQPHISEAAIAATQKVIPLMAEMLEGLATAFDKELNDKEEDHSQAQRLLDSSTHEIQTCKATSEETLAPFGDIATMEAQIEALKVEADALAEQLKEVFECGQYHDLSGLVREEVEQLPLQEKEAVDEDTPEAWLGKFEAAKELGQLQQERIELRDTIVKAYARSGAGERMSDYRRLIALSCSLLPEDVEKLLPEILKDLEAGGDGGIGDGLMI